MLKPALAIFLFGCGGAPSSTTSPSASGNEAPADIKLKPAGVGWFCTTSSAAPSYQPCFRTQADCDQQVARNTSVFPPCEASPAAYCYTEDYRDVGSEAPWTPKFECSYTGIACANYTRDRNLEHQRKDGSRTHHKNISLCTKWD